MADQALRVTRIQLKAAQIQAAQARKLESDPIGRKVSTNEARKKDHDARVGYSSNQADT